MKFASEIEFTSATVAAWDTMWDVVSSYPIAQLEIRVATRPGGEPRSVKDTLAHVYAWHLLLLGWLGVGPDGSPNLPALGFKWSETRLLNAALHDEYAEIPFGSVRRRLKLSHNRVMKTVAGFSERELLAPGYFCWTGKLPLMSYVAPNTVSHYRWAGKKLLAISKRL